MDKSIISQNNAKNALKIDTDSVLFARYVYNLLAVKKISSAQNIALAGIKKSPNFATGRFVLALCLIEEKEYDLAKFQLYEVLKIEPTHQYALAKLVEVLQMLEMYEEARKVEDYLARLNPKSHFLGKNSCQGDSNDTLYEILGEKLNWKEFASKSYLNNDNKKEFNEKTENIEENNEDKIGDEILAELKEIENTDIVKDVFDGVTLTVKDEALEYNDETDYDEELEKFASIYDDFAGSAFVDSLDEITHSYDDIEIDESKNQEEAINNKKETIDTPEKENEFTDFKNLIEENIAALPLEKPIPHKSSRSSHVISETTEVSIDEIQQIMNKTNGNPDENKNNKQTKEKPDKSLEFSAPTILENSNQQLNEYEQKAEPISEKEAFADMLAKNGTDLLPDHILTPTFAQIYLEQEQPFLAKQIYERLLANDSENEEYLKKLSEVNKIIEKMKNGEAVVIEPQKSDRKRVKAEKVPVTNKKSLKGKRIKKEIREALKEKHSANSRESTQKK